MEFTQILASGYIAGTVTFGAIVGMRYAQKRDLNWWETAFYTGTTGFLGIALTPLYLGTKALDCGIRAFSDF